ncbi:MAG: ABC transporter substrate binding protein [Elusimicrobiales bacterium]|nr:ABC transporter substrate binding protein [Elusimicrobiales bacterium]
MSFKGLACCALLLLPAAAAAGDTAAVLSYGGGAYQEAFTAFEKNYGESVHKYDLSSNKPDLSEGIRTVVVFGGRAANLRYPRDSDIIYCMAPGIFIKAPGGGKAVKISLVPEFSVVFSKIKQMQPGIGRLQIFWMLPDFSKYIDTVKIEAARQGIQVTTKQLISMEELPALLRLLPGTADAFWIPPDPMLITRENLTIMRDFSWANGIPFYGSTKGMTRDGAAASIGVSFSEMGKAAAAAALELRKGDILPETIFPGQAEITINSDAAAKCGLKFPRAVLDEAEFRYP